MASQGFVQKRAQT